MISEVIYCIPFTVCLLFQKSPIAGATAVIWRIFEPLLFGLVGAEVDIKYLEGSLVGRFCFLLVSFKFNYNRQQQLSLFTLTR